MSEINCPKCRDRLETVTYANIEVDRCINCKGIWFDVFEMQELKKLEGAESIDIGSSETGSRYDAMGAVACPKCGAQLVKTLDPQQSQICYEKCPECYGVWLDAGEFTGLREENEELKQLLQTFLSESLDSPLDGVLDDSDVVGARFD